jgi:hypothetical protein
MRKLRRRGRFSEREKNANFEEKSKKAIFREKRKFWKKFEFREKICI